MAARTAPTPGPARSTASRAAPGPRSTSSAPPPWNASPATPAKAAPSRPPTPGTSPASPTQDVERFQGDVGWATDKVDACEIRLARLADAVAHGDEWHAQNDWRHQRLVSIERELTDLGHIDLRTVPLPGSRPDRSRDL